MKATWPKAVEVIAGGRHHYRRRRCRWCNPKDGPRLAERLAHLRRRCHRRPFSDDRRRHRHPHRRYCRLGRNPGHPGHRPRDRPTIQDRSRHVPAWNSPAGTAPRFTSRSGSETWSSPPACEGNPCEYRLQTGPTRTQDGRRRLQPDSRLALLTIEMVETPRSVPDPHFKVFGTGGEVRWSHFHSEHTDPDRVPNAHESFIALVNGLIDYFGEEEVRRAINALFEESNDETSA